MLYHGEPSGVGLLLEHLLHQLAVMVADGILEVVEPVREDALHQGVIGKQRCTAES